MKPTIYKYILLVWTTCLLYACSKYEDKLDVQNRSSGIIRVGKEGAKEINGAKIDEMVTVYAKIGEPDATIKIYVGGVEATQLEHGKGYTTILSESGGNPLTVQMDTFNIRIPATSKIGPGIIYFTVNGQSKPALGFEVLRPDILIPGQSFVEPFLFTYMDSAAQQGGGYYYSIPQRLKDGRSGEAVVNKVLGLTYDEAVQAFYFVDVEPDDLSYRIRKLQNNVVTTIAGGGNDFKATTASQLKLTAVEELKPGPDGKLYFTSIFATDPDPVTQRPSNYALIQRLDPVTGAIEIVLGGTRSINNYASRYNDEYRGIEDGGKDSAMVYFPQSLTFDKEGVLYFLDGPNENANYGSLLRRFKNGKLETVLGKVSKDAFDFEDIDGNTYTYITYATIDEHSDGFGDAVRLAYTAGLVQAGNGKFYILNNGGAGWATNIMEVNMDTREASTIVGTPDGQHVSINTGTFREVNLDQVTTFDLDFDGNILFGRAIIYKMDLQKETIAKVAGGGHPPGQALDRDIAKVKQKGEEASIGVVDRIVFDQFGNLYAGYSSTVPNVDVRIGKITIEQ